MITTCIITCYYIFTILSPNITVVTAFCLMMLLILVTLLKPIILLSVSYLTLNFVFSFENYFCSFVIYFGHKMVVSADAAILIQI